MMAIQFCQIAENLDSGLHGRFLKSSAGEPGNRQGDC
jgi:hypothetical protein